MPLPFAHFCTLLSHLESHACHEPPFPRARCEELSQRTLSHWIHHHQVSVSSTHVDAVVFLSSLLPARRTDRVYGIQADSLTKTLGRSLNLGIGRLQQLGQWKLPGRGDLGDCVERIQRQAENAIPLVEVTLEEIDSTLASIAQGSRFSAPSVRRAAPENNSTRIEILRCIYTRLQSREAKWFTRMILKDYGRLQLKEGMVLSCLDYRLPAMIKTRDTFEAAVASLRDQGHRSHRSEQSLSQWTGHQPKVGTKVGRTIYLKARSINHAVQMIHGRTMSLERKYDGEYCQIHIDLSKGNECIQIFSKSGKDSTRDRVGLHQQIKDSLRIGQEDCHFSENCIVEGEMVVWSDKEEHISSFNKIRKHVSRAGSFLGTTWDSQPHPYEHLMIYYYDVMLIDYDPVLNESHSSRRRVLEQLVTPIKGRAELVSWKKCDFSSPNGPKKLQQHFASAIAHGWEGLVLKPSHEAYFRAPAQPTDSYASCWIKLKKDYIPGLGDTADFAVVGAAFNASEAAKLRIEKLSWTRFHMGCLINKSDVLESGARPHFIIIDSLNSCISPKDLVHLNRMGQFQAVPFGSDRAAEACTVELAPGVSNVSVVFRKPFVFEVLGSGFEKTPNQNFYTLRFPRVLKVQWDRDWIEAVDLDELQIMAENARASSQHASSNIATWVERLDQVNGASKGIMQPWYDSDGDDYEQAPKLGSPSAPKSAAPPLIRIDTGDMSPDQPSEDADSKRHISLSTGSGVSENSLPTPPPSFPSQSDPAEEPRRTPKKTLATTKVGTRKRLVSDGIENEPLKKTKPQSLVLSTSDESNATSTSSSSVTQPQPLQPIVNSHARPRITPAIKPASARDPSTFSLVRKMGTRIDGSRPVKSKGESDSQGRETTVECSTDATTQSTHDSSSNPNSSSDWIFTLLSHFTLPNSTDAEQPETFIIPIPSLTTSSFILGPDVAKMHYCQDLLRSPPVTVIPFPSASSPLSAPAKHPGHPPSQDTILLVESFRTQPTVDLLKDLVRTVPRGSSTVIAMWDWRLLEDLKRAAAAEGWRRKSRELDVRGHFFARMHWFPEGGILVRWGDGTGRQIRGDFAEKAGE